MHPCSACIAATVTARKTSGGHVKGATFEFYACGAVIQRTTSLDGCAACGGGIFCVTAPGPDPRETVTALITAEGWQVAA